MKSMFVFALFVITGTNCFPLSVRNRRSGPDGDNLDPVGSARLRPVFLGQPTGINNMRTDFSSRQTRGQTSLEPQEVEGPEGPFESTGAQMPEESEDMEDANIQTNERQFGLPNSAIQERIHRERIRKDRLRNRLVIHPDSDALKGKRNHFIVDDPLPEMVAGGDMGANPFVDKTSFSSIIQQLFLESIGLQ